jgi:hypothetical protein
MWHFLPDGYCRASEGGGMYLSFKSVPQEFNSSRATSSVFLSDTLIQGNSARVGGGIWLKGVYARISRSKILNNR